jgi:hypothetical protein
MRQFLRDKAGGRRIDSKDISEPAKMADGFFQQ